LIKNIHAKFHLSDCQNSCFISARPTLTTPKCMTLKMSTSKKLVQERVKTTTETEEKITKSSIKEKKYIHQLFCLCTNTT